MGARTPGKIGKVKGVKKRKSKMYGKETGKWYLRNPNPP